MPDKPAWLSKTLVVNSLVILDRVVAYITGHQAVLQSLGLTPENTVMVLAAANWILRWITKTGVTMKLK